MMEINRSKNLSPILINLSVLVELIHHQNFVLTLLFCLFSAPATTTILLAHLTVRGRSATTGHSAASPVPSPTTSTSTLQASTHGIATLAATVLLSVALPASYTPTTFSFGQVSSTLPIASFSASLTHR